jgi:hypothetical protein
MKDDSLKEIFAPMTLLEELIDYGFPEKICK